MLLIYSAITSHRLVYVCDFIWTHVCPADYQLTNDLDVFQKYEGAKLNYSRQSIPGSLQVVPQGLLEEQQITATKPEVANGDRFYLFPSNGDLPFDVFAAVFYMISRYEEWQAFTADKHQRFEASQSMLFQYKQLHRPVVDLWCMELKAALSRQFPQLVFTSRHFQYISTIDVDNTYAYLGKSWFRILGASVKDRLKGNTVQLRQRRAVVSGREQDPFAAYEQQVKISREYGVPLIYFFLTVEQQTEFDRSLPCRHPLFRSALETVKGKATIGLHPSYGSASGPAIQHEKKNLEEISGKAVTQSRQHYLHFDIRTTPHQLMEAGIQVDHTMGFASHDGFRAGTCTPFLYFDLEKNEVTSLKMVPFCMMDSVYYDYLKLTPETAMQRMKQLADEVKQVHGTLVSVWHDRSFSPLHFPGWYQNYQALHQYSVS